MIKPSAELIAITRRWSAAVANKDGATVKNLLSSSDHLSYIGTAFDEYWSGSVLRDGFGDHIQEIPDLTQEELHIEAFECGEVGWSVWKGILKFSNMEQPAQLRVSMVFALENGHWKVVQHHGSNPSRNIDVIGIEHTVLDDLVSAAKEGFRQDQREGMASVMFTDIANSSVIADMLGNRAWASAIQRHLETVSGAISENDGTLVKSLGDGTMSTFDSARSAMNAAIAIQTLMANADSEPKLQLRIGIHTGDVIQTKDDFFGTVVNKAARIAGAALPKEIRVSQATQIMVGDAAGFSFTDATTVALKGLEGDHLIYCVKAD